MAYNIKMTYSYIFVTPILQFVMKLEEKMHAKEDEMNKVQARKQVHDQNDSVAILCM